MDTKRWRRVDKKYVDELKKYRVYCDCGHSMIMTGKDKIVCYWCGSVVYKNKRVEFAERLKQISKR